MISLAQSPDVLSLHIKRFSHYNSYYNGKLGRHIKFPLKALNMTPFLHPDATSTLKGAGAGNLYDLFGLVRHMGGTGGGHYISYSRQHVTVSACLFAQCV